MGGMLLEHRKQFNKVFDIREATEDSGSGMLEEEMEYRPRNGKEGKERGQGNVWPLPGPQSTVLVLGIQGFPISPWIRQAREVLQVHFFQE